ncbi:uncharacterized protein RJT20DRAFT_100724 [Scheffersomyces xylosifermentans]|uniref:uncharacterized protein n=1 Tax=Scheffersomyces xylosifermentans TaxID=1304137 RepID=UPI00315D8F77
MASKRSNSIDIQPQNPGQHRIKRKKPTWQSGSTFKLLKACNFCRKRKIKCVIKANSNICESCKYHKKGECVFDHKIISNNNGSSSIINSPPSILPHNLLPSHNSITNISPTISSSGIISHRKSDSAISSASSPASPPMIKNSPASTGLSSSSLQVSGSYKGAPSPTNSILSPTSMPLTNNIKSARQSMFELYQSNIEPYTPFIPYEVFHTNNYNDLDQFSKCCINIATVSSPNNKIPESAIELFLEFLNNFLSTGSIVWNETTLSCFLLMPLRIPIDSAIIEKSLLFFNELYEAKPETISINLILGAMTIDAYYSLFCERKLTTNPNIRHRALTYLHGLDDNSFNYHFLYVGYFIYKMIWLAHADNLSFSDRKYEFLQLEFDMLLWPAKLTKDLSVVKDKLLATPEAFILHVLHNTLLTAFYTKALQHKDVIGKMISISAVPGLYHFISGMAKSNFRVTNEIVGRWTIIANCRVQTAKLLLDLNEIMDFDAFKSTLRLFTKKSNVKDLVWQDRIYNRVQQLLSESVIDEDDDDVDGAVVFWVFRDVRSMSLQTYINEEKQRRVGMGNPAYTLPS